MSCVSVCDAVDSTCVNLYAVNAYSDRDEFLKATWSVTD